MPLFVKHSSAKLYSQSAGGARGGRDRSRKSARRGLDNVELGRLGQDAAEVLGVRDEVHAEALARLPATTGRVDGDLAQSSIDKCVQDLRSRRLLDLRVGKKSNSQFCYWLPPAPKERIAYLVVQDDSEVGGIGRNLRPGDDVRAAGGPAGCRVGLGDGVCQSGCSESEEGEGGTHGWEYQWDPSRQGHGAC